MALKFRNESSAEINTVYKPPQQIQDDRHSVYKRYSYMKFGREKIEPEWESGERRYESWRPEKKQDDWQSTIVPPLTTTIVEKALAEVIDQTIQPTVVARGDEDKVKAKVMNYIKDYTWEIGDGDLEMYSAIKQSLILGKTVWREDYWKDRRIVKVLSKFDPDKKEEVYVQKEITDFDDVYGQNINLRNFYIDPQAWTINRGRYKANDVIERMIMNYDTFQETFIGSIYDQFGVAKLVKPGGDTNYYQFYTPPEGIDKDNQVEVLLYWGRRPDKFIIMANDIVVRDGPNPYNHKQLPYAEGSDIPRLNQFWAKGEPKLLESLQDELTTNRRMRTDRQYMDIWKMFLVSNRENLDDDEAIVAPSRFLYVDDPNNSIKALEYRDINPSAYKEEEILRQDARQVSGIESPAPSGTATEAAIFKEATMKSLRMKIWLLSRELLTNIIRLRVPNISQYYTLPKAEKVIGEQKFAQYRSIRTTDMQLSMSKEGQLQEQKMKGEYFFTVTPDLITPQWGGFDYKLSGAPTFPISKPLQQQKIGEFMQHPITQLNIQSGYWDAGKMGDEYAEIMEYDPDKFKSEKAKQQPDAISEDVLYEMANRENEQMLKGIPIQGTPYATIGHTRIHLAFMQSQQYLDRFAQLNPAEKEQITKIFVRHISWEEQEQKARAQAGQAPQGMVPSQGGGQGGQESQPIMGGESKATQPAKQLGPENTPAGMGML